MSRWLSCIMLFAVLQSRQIPFSSSDKVEKAKGNDVVVAQTKFHKYCDCIASLTVIWACRRTAARLSCLERENMQPRFQNGE